MPQYLWQQPDLSIGLPHAALDSLGRYKCWSLREESPAHTVWKSVSQGIISLLEDQFEHLEAGDSELMIEMFMIGRKAAKSTPTILFSCESKICRQRAMELVQKKGILNNHPSILMAESSRLPRLLALGDELAISALPLTYPSHASEPNFDLHNEHDNVTQRHSLTSVLTPPPGVYIKCPLQSFGTPIMIYSEGSKFPRKATLGGLLSINGSISGLTTAHAFWDTQQSESQDIEDLDFAFYGVDDRYDSSDSEEELVESTSQGKRTR